MVVVGNMLSSDHSTLPGLFEMRWRGYTCCTRLTMAKTTMLDQYKQPSVIKPVLLPLVANLSAGTWTTASALYYNSHKRLSGATVCMYPCQLLLLMSVRMRTGFNSRLSHTLDRFLAQRPYVFFCAPGKF